MTWISYVSDVADRQRLRHHTVTSRTYCTCTTLPCPKTVTALLANISRHYWLFSASWGCGAFVIVWFLCAVYKCSYLLTYLLTYACSTLGRRALSVSGPTVWNSLPDELRDPSRADETFRHSRRKHFYLYSISLPSDVLYVYFYITLHYFRAIYTTVRPAAQPGIY